MAFRKLFAVLLGTVLLGGLLASGAIPASASHSSRVFSGTDAAGDSEFSSLCLFDDREPDPYFGVGGTGVHVANCDNQIGETDFTNWGFEYVPASSSDALFNPAGNDGLWGTSDDARGPDGKSGSGDEPCTGSNPYPGCSGAQPILSRRMGTLKATWNFSKPWPLSTHVGAINAAGSRNSEVISGLSAFLAFRNADIQRNDLQPLCDRDVQGPTAFGQPTYIYDTSAYFHYLDGTYFHIWVSWELAPANVAGTGPRADQQHWRPRLNYGFYDPTIDNDIHYSSTPQNNPLYNPYNTGITGNDPWTGLGRFYDWQWSNGNQTLTVKFPAIYVTITSPPLVNALLSPAIGGTCRDQGPGPNQQSYSYKPFARIADEKTGSQAIKSVQTGQPLNPGNGQNDVLFDIAAQVFVSVRPTLPVPIPTGSLICANVCPIYDSLPRPLPGVPPGYPITRQDIDWVIGVGFTADEWQLPNGSDAWIGGLLTPTLGPRDFQGPTCNINTLGGHLPNNPLWNRGNQCALRNPYNIGLQANNNHVHVF